MDSQVFILNEKRNVTLTAYLQDDSQEFWRAKKRPAVVIFPGGAYAYCSDREADPVAQEYLRAGYHAFVLRYSVGWENAVWPNPLEDYDQAMELIAAHAKEWHLIPEKIAVIGFSAGGHLAASLSTLAKDINRPDFAILYYPVISFDNKMAHQGSKKNLLGKNIDNEKLIDYYSLNKQVDDKTPKTLLLLSYDDRVVPPMNSILYYIALNEHHIPASLHMFPNGGHGWGIRYDFAYYQEVKDLILKWLRYTQIID